MDQELVSSGGRYDDSMTLDEAVKYLRELLSEFPFGDWKDGTGLDGEPCRQSRSLAVQIAAMLSQFAVACVPRGANRMGFIYNANSQRSGKTLLAKIAIMVLYCSFKAQSWKSDEDDLAKVIDSEVLAGSTYICFDNVRGYVGSQALEGLMTSPDWTGRVLGRTQMFTAENRLTLFITGNDCIVSPDMAHRCLICDLFVPEGNVQERRVKNLIDEVWLQKAENRHRVLSALWAIVRYWHQAGSPSASSFGFKPRLGFERWGETIGGMVAFAGFGNALEPVLLENAGDSLDRNIRQLVAKLAELNNTDTEEYRFQEVVNICHDCGFFDWLLDGRDTDGGDFKLTHKANSSFAKHLLKFAPSKEPRAYRFEEDGGRKTVFFSNRGSGKERRYIVQISHSPGSVVQEAEAA